MARDKLTTTLRKEFYAIQENLPGSNASALSGGDRRGAAVGNHELESHHLDDLDGTRRNANVYKAPTEDACGRCSARKDAILGILVENKLGRLRVGNAHPIGMCYCSMRIEFGRMDSDPAVAGGPRPPTGTFYLVVHVCCILKARRNLS